MKSNVRAIAAKLLLILFLSSFLTNTRLYGACGGGCPGGVEDCTTSDCPVCDNFSFNCVACSALDETDCANNSGICAWNGVVCDAVVASPEFPSSYWFFAVLAGVLLIVLLLSRRRKPASLGK